MSNMSPLKSSLKLPTFEKIWRYKIFSSRIKPLHHKKYDFWIVLKHTNMMFKPENWGSIINHIEPTLNIRLISKNWKISAWNFDVWSKFIAFLDSSESHKYGVKRAIKSEYIFLVKSSPEYSKIRSPIKGF